MQVDEKPRREKGWLASQGERQRRARRRLLPSYKTRCYACGARLRVTDNDDPDFVLIKHRFKRCSKKIEPWERDRRALLGVESSSKKKHKPRRERRDA